MKENQIEKIESLPNIEKIMSINSSYENDEFDDAARTEVNTPKVSEEAFLRNFKYVVEEEKKDPKEKNNNSIFTVTSSLMNILDRDSMLNNPNRNLYIEGLKELYKKIYKEDINWVPKNTENK